MKKRHLLLTALLVFFSLSIFAAEDDLNQYGNGSSFARVTAVEGTLNVKRDVNEMKGVERNFVVEAMDEISTEYASRAVIQFIDGSMIKLDENTKIDFLKIGGDEKSFSFLVRVFSGKIYADISDDETFQEREFRVDTKDATVFLLSAGRYTVDVLDYLSKVKTIAGLAEVSLENGSKLVRSGEFADVDGSAKSVVVRNFNTFYMDDFTRWATSTYNRQLAESSQYVPDQIKHYVSDLDENGSWYYDTEVERYVWRPAIISVDWTPYTNGYWAYSPYGSTWVSSYSWGWAPFHYGSWYFSASLGWCWNPGYYYSPAWVSWSCWDGYIGWYPYSHYHHHHGHRGVVVRNDIRDRVVCVRGNNFYNRHVTVVRNVRPNKATVVRTVKPIAPNPVRVSSKPYRAISTAIKNPVKVATVRSAHVKPIRSNVTTVKPVKSRTTIKTTERSVTVTKGRAVKPGKSSVNSRNIKVTPRGTTGSSRSIKVTPRGTKTTSRSIKVTPKGSSSSSRIIKTRPSKSSSSSTKSRSITIKSPTVRDRYVRPQSSSSSSSRGRTIKTNPYRSEIKRPSYSSSYSSRTVKRSTPSSSYTTPKTSSKSYSKPSRSSYSYTKPTKSSSKTYTAPKRSSSKSYSTPSRTTSRSSSSSSSSSSTRSSRRR